MTTRKELLAFYEKSVAKKAGWKLEAFNGCYWLSKELGRYVLKTKGDAYCAIQMLNEQIRFPKPQGENEHE